MRTLFSPGVGGGPAHARLCTDGAACGKGTSLRLPKTPNNCFADCCLGNVSLPQKRRERQMREKRKAAMALRKQAEDDAARRRAQVRGVCVCDVCVLSSCSAQGTHSTTSACVVAEAGGAHGSGGHNVALYGQRGGATGGAAAQAGAAQDFGCTSRRCSCGEAEDGPRQCQNPDIHPGP